MGRLTHPVGDGRTVVLGWDPPFRSWFAQLWDDGQDPDVDSPARAVGYHPAERALDPDPEYGPYPVATAVALIAYCRDHWQVELPADLLRSIDVRGG